MKTHIKILALVMSVSCTNSVSEWEGEWKATWVTSPSSFEEIEGIKDYTMPGLMIFEGEKVNIKAFGFEGCIFSRDTLDHTMAWKVSNDSLILLNDEDAPGMVYAIKEKSNNKIMLQLMEDLFINLER